MEVGNLDDKDKLLNLDAILLAIDNNLAALERLGQTLGSASRSQYVVEDCHLEDIALGLTCSYVANAVVFLNLFLNAFCVLFNFSQTLHF